MYKSISCCESNGLVGGWFNDWLGDLLEIFNKYVSNLEILIYFYLLIIYFIFIKVH